MGLYASINKNLKEYDEQLSLFPDDSQYEQLPNEILDEVKLGDDTLDSVSLVYFDGKFGIGKNICSVHDSGYTYFLSDDEIKYYDTEEVARKEFDKRVKDEKNQAAIKWLQKHGR